LRDKCAKKGVSFFYKQGADFLPGEDSILDGQAYKNWPACWLN